VPIYLRENSTIYADTRLIEFRKVFYEDLLAKKDDTGRYEYDYKPDSPFNKGTVEKLSTTYRNNGIVALLCAAACVGIYFDAKREKPLLTPSGWSQFTGWFAGIFSTVGTFISVNSFLKASKTAIKNRFKKQSHDLREELARQKLALIDEETDRNYRPL